MKSSEAAAARLYNVSAYFEPDILAPFQFAKANRRRDHLHPEEKLMFAAKDLPDLVDVAGLIDKLEEFRTGKHKLPR